MKNTTPLQWRDTALAFTLVLLLVGIFYPHEYWNYAAMGLLIFAMVFPRGMAPFARLWYGLSAALGHVVSTVLLCAIYLCLLVPVGLCRRLMGKDAMRLKGWKKDQSSVFIVKDHVYTSEDIVHPY